MNSSVPGVQLWHIQPDNSSYPSEIFEVHERSRNEFAQHCNGERKIYVSSSDNPVTCRAIKDTSKGHFYSIELVSNDPKLRGLVVVSLRPLPNRTVPEPLSEAEQKELEAAIAPLRSKYQNQMKTQYVSYGDPKTNRQEYLQALRQAPASPSYKKHFDANHKVQGAAGTMLIAPIAVDTAYIGWNLLNAAFLVHQGTLKLLGVFSGCIQGFRDVNADGNPDVLTRTCENDEGTAADYYGLIPKVKGLMGRSQ